MDLSIIGVVADKTMEILTNIIGLIVSISPENAFLIKVGIAVAVGILNYQYLRSPTTSSIITSALTFLLIRNI